MNIRCTTSYNSTSCYTARS